MRVFLDSNVLVSAFATRGLSADVMRLVIADHELLTGEVVLEELHRVLGEKFGVSERTLDAVDALLRGFHVEPRPAVLPKIEVRDPDDAWVLATAFAAGAEVLVTGDKDLLDLRGVIEELLITDPRGFWELVRSTGS